MSIDPSLLLPLGWSNDFLRQLTLEQLETRRPARIIGVGQDHYHIDDGHGAQVATLAGRYRHRHATDSTLPTVGDWVLLEADASLIVERLEPRSLLLRRGAGGSEPQAIAANVDVLLIVSGLDAEFNVHRIERYLVMAAQAGVTPLVLLTKADLYPDVEPALAAVRPRLPPGGEVFAIDALHAPLAERLAPWLGAGTTLVVAGSSGVGKSTLINNLAGTELQATQATRRDAKGRHTTTARELVRLPGGACIIDVPGMREVGLAPAAGGVEAQFHSLHELAARCRYTDCRHADEPGCAVQAARQRGELDEDAWQHYLKLLAEERHNIAAHERHQRERAFGRMVRAVLKDKERHGRR
ncbi:ribosome small subunit-dependent GTPase A [Sulfurivermis fontis]|uniref:ribosome small subunit-dependent GTPase A n=1 Tax=Sulfurivermis fontis TaxID=1972068 RepID=UPI000FD99DB7|nr:ribosome small subunit-dependent GTPase A [Sulfurivermis fontis]